ncbi:hypothetical protein C471_14640 [Halorubrum saccharovorum DSM 1137]|uniref:Uncharacterized protein n=1 Tax=Halorubrum saccharovorum DSM 1137 TaxID=1227484 RepID=M0DM76_9EURY|nr:hypothetical protein C471_14640 [Halorubrum saccharovorum DSM 1137]
MTICAGSEGDDYVDLDKSVVVDGELIYRVAVVITVRRISSSATEIAELDITQVGNRVIGSDASSIDL